MSEFILKMDKWDRVENSYIYPRTPNKSSWRRTGLVPENDYTADCSAGTDCPLKRRFTERKLLK